MFGFELEIRDVDTDMPDCAPLTSGRAGSVTANIRLEVIL
jgi:hypothetical protein